VTVTFLRTDGSTLVKQFTVSATSRFTIPINGDPAGSVPELTNESFAATVSSTQPVIVERSMYTTTNGLLWTAGTNSTGIALQP
jgi:hypothetical protein